jgi:hypothetical protein
MNRVPWLVWLGALAKVTWHRSSNADALETFDALRFVSRLLLASVSIDGRVE